MNLLLIDPRKVKPLLRSLAEDAAKQGWRIFMRPNGHLRWESPEGAVVFTSATPTDWRAVHRVRADLRRNGYKG